MVTFAWKQTNPAHQTKSCWIHFVSPSICNGLVFFYFWLTRLYNLETFLITNVSLEVQSSLKEIKFQAMLHYQNKFYNISYILVGNPWLCHSSPTVYTIMLQHLFVNNIASVHTSRCIFMSILPPICNQQFHPLRAPNARHGHIQLAMCKYRLGQKNADHL